MTSLLAVFGFLAAVLYPGHSLSCEKCTGYGSTSCQGSIESCKKGNSMCIQKLENNTLDGDIRLTASKACYNPQEMPPFVCEASEHSIQNSHFLLRLMVKCGQDMDELEVPPVNMSHNGHKCPDCNKEGSIEECKTDKVIECVGRQTECYSYHGKTKRPGFDLMPYSTQGCSTPGFCSIVHLLPGTHIDMSASQYKCAADL